MCNGNGVAKIANSEDDITFMMSEKRCNLDHDAW
jgi:hypothetical protein